MINAHRQKPVQYIICHGHFIEQITETQQIVLTDLKKCPSRGQKTVFLLGSPYVKAFVHNTIKFKQNELKAADQFILPFSPVPPEHRSICSIVLSYKNNLTLHAHLTPAGQLLLKKIKEKFRFITWKPLIPFLANHYLQIEKQKHAFVFLFGEEMMLLKFKNRQYTIRHCPYWPTSKQNFSFTSIYPKALQIEKDPQPVMLQDLSQKIRSDDNNLIPHLLSNLLFSPPVIKSKERKSVKKDFQRFPGIQKALSPLKVLTASLIFLLLWSLQVHISLNSEKELKEKLSRQYQHLKQITKVPSHRFQEQTDRLKITAYQQSLKQMDLTIQNKILKINQILPQKTWLSKLEISQFHMLIQLITPPLFELDSIMKTLKKNYPKITLLSTQSIEKNNLSLTRYTLKIYLKKN